MELVSQLGHYLKYRDKLTAYVGRYVDTSETLCLGMAFIGEAQLGYVHIPVLFALTVWRESTLAFITVFSTQHCCF